MCDVVPTTQPCLSMLARGNKLQQKINLLLSSMVQRHQELRARAPTEILEKSRGTGPASRHRITLATATQTKNKTGRIHWKRAKRNMETKYGLRIIGILIIGTLREKEDVTLLMDERRRNIFGISETREEISVVSKCPHTSTRCSSEQRPSTGVRMHPINTNLHAASCQRDNASRHP